MDAASLFQKKGELVGLPPAGQVAYFTDSSGNLKQVDSAGTITSVGGGGNVGLAPWFSNVAAAMQKLQGTLVAATLVSECTSVSLELEAQAATGTGTAAVSASIAGGVVSSTSGVTMNSFRLLRNRNGKNEPVISNMQTAPWVVAVRTQLLQPGATSMLYQCGISDESAIDAFLGQKTTVSGTNYVMVVGSTTVDTGVAFDTSKDYTLIMFANGTAIQAYLGAADGTGIVAIGATIAQSHAANLPAAIRIAAFNQGTAANCAFNTDAILVLTERAA